MTTQKAYEYYSVWLKNFVTTKNMDANDLISKKGERENCLGNGASQNVCTQEKNNIYK